MHRNLVGQLDSQALRRHLSGGGLGVQLGPFDVRLQVLVPELIPVIGFLYAHCSLVSEPEHVWSMHVRLEPVWSRHRPFRRVRFTVDGVAPHEDMARAHALTVLEWGINLVIALRFHRYLLLHAAAVERNGRVMLLPAAPGDGKSTLCAALCQSGWRLLSDEFGMLEPGRVDVIPIPRPIPLKNQSIDVLRAFAPGAVWGPTVHGTRKGTVAHVRPSRECVERSQVRAPVRWLVFPKWQSGAPLQLDEVSPSDAFMRLATNSFNYEMHGEPGFITVRDVVAGASCRSLVYSHLAEAVRALTDLADARE